MVPEEILERTAVDDVSPRYLRKQKPASATRRRVRHAGPAIRRGALALLISCAIFAAAGGAAYFLLFSPAMRLHRAQIEIAGAQYVPRGELTSIFAADIGRSILRVPLNQRLTAIEQIPWVRTAVVERVLPNRLYVSIVERTPIAFLSTRSGMKVIDADGVILDRPAGAHFNLPVVSGIDAGTPAAERVGRLEMFSEFLKQIATVLPGADAKVSEANLSNANDVQATLAGLPILAGQGPVVVHFGHADFAYRLRLFLRNFASWQARAGNVEAVDLRYDGEALVTPETPFSAGAPAGAAPATAAVAAAMAPTPPLSALTRQTAAGEGLDSVSTKHFKGSARN
ncbi:MAG TPA: FtsQ-type POTRA domain-containing protein [Patescibacteria group bacterium]|nr:FtsQ-type POTRA domain-containing protein [Patescibacteria group bacterium]